MSRPDHPPVEDETLQELDVVLFRSTHKRSTLYALIAQGRFPRPVKIGPRRVAWRKRDVDQWIHDAIAGRPWSGPLQTFPAPAEAGYCEGRAPVPSAGGRTAGHLCDREAREDALRPRGREGQRQPGRSEKRGPMREPSKGGRRDRQSTR